MPPTTLDNSCSIPCAVHYVTKKGKTGEKMKDFLETQCKILQICQSCQAEASSVENGLNEDATDLCKSICDDCFNNKKVCDARKDQGKPAINLPCKHEEKVLMQEKSASKWPSLPALLIAKKVTR